MNDKPLIRLSQSQLNLLESCPPQFQRLYLEQLGMPMSPEQQERLSWGSQFHLLMQQQELGLSVDALLKEDEQLRHSLTALVQAVPLLNHPSSNSWQEAEHYRTLAFNGYLLSVIYDLLIADSDRAYILDWKTYLQPENKSKLERNWQTRLYLYVLAETSDYLPEQISMTYWFVKLPKEPQSLTFTYNSQQHEQTERDLSNIFNKLDGWLNDYASKGIDFPHLANCEETCFYYSQFGEMTHKNSQLSSHYLENISEIEEIPI